MNLGGGGTQCRPQQDPSQHGSSLPFHINLLCTPHPEVTPQPSRGLGLPITSSPHLQTIPSANFLKKCYPLLSQFKSFLFFKASLDSPQEPTSPPPSPRLLSPGCLITTCCLRAGDRPVCPRDRRARFVSESGLGFSPAPALVLALAAQPCVRRTRALSSRSFYSRRGRGCSTRT